ncbi:MAG: GNAT family N-acetyltransferase [Clostridia bacterium]|nr:GNAT family N-acetyltransferase [Clostridia bacterium]
MLTTERLCLRPWEPGDAEALYELARDPEVGPWTGWPPHQSITDSKKVLRDVLMAEENYAILLKETGQVIGSIGLLFPGQANLDLQKGEAELGAWLGKPYWGKEYAVEAAREVIRHGFEDLGLSRIYGGNFDGNQKSERLQKKLGFRYRRTIEDYYVPQLNEYKRLHLRVLINPEWEI